MSHERPTVKYESVQSLWSAPYVNLALTTLWSQGFLWSFMQYLKLCLTPQTTSDKLWKFRKKGIPPSQQNWLYFKGFSRRISSKYIQHYFHHSCTWFHFIQIVWAKSTPEFVGHCSSGLVPLATLQDGAGPRRYFPTLIHHDLRFSWLSLLCS